MTAEADDRGRARDRLSRDPAAVLCAGRPRHGGVRRRGASDVAGSVRRTVPHLRRQSRADRRLPASRHRSRCRCDLRQRRATSSSPASWSISRKPACIPATPPAPSRPTRSKPETIAEIERQTIALARALKVRGLMNVQYAVQGGDIYVLEVNPRASRTVPFVAKAIGLPVAAIAARVMAGELLAVFDLKPSTSPHISVKEAVMPFARFPGVDTILGPGDALDRRSHGPRPQFRPRLRQEPDRRRPQAAAGRHRVHLGQGCRQGRGRSRRRAN